MKDRGRREWLAAGGLSGAAATTSSSSTWRCGFFVFACCLLISALTFSTFTLFGVSFRPAKLVSTWQNPTMSAVAGDGDPFVGGDSSPQIEILQAVSLPDQLVFFLNPKNSGGGTAAILCLYFPPSSSIPTLHHPTISITGDLARCPAAPRGFSASLSVAGAAARRRPLMWDRLAYAALIDGGDNTTVVFAKGLNLRPARLSDPSRLSCQFGWDFSNPKYIIPSPAITAAQEVIRCPTPLSVLLRLRHSCEPPPLVSVAVAGSRGSSFPLPSVASPEIVAAAAAAKLTMCVCTMIRNQARFLREWLSYHSRIGVERWFIYDNNSDDGVEQVVGAMDFDIKIRAWPWAKTQEAGFAHCAINAAASCEWVGFIDVDEFLYLPGNATLPEIIRNYSGAASPSIGELRTPCHSFGPSGRSSAPAEGVVLGYTCRMGVPERHKSIVRPAALNPSLINIVHHFHLKQGWRYVNMDRGVMVINHYKYQAWEVFKEKFFRRVATYVADWQDDENAGSKDRAPGLGTKAVEPPDWPSRFCEVNDTGLRDRVIRDLADPSTGRLPWLVMAAGEREEEGSLVQ